MDKNTIANRHAHDMATIENTNFSKGVRRMLGLPLDSWNNITLSFLGVAAFAAAIVGISTYAVVQLQKLEAKDASDALEQYKIDAGKEVATAKESAASALERAAGAEQRAAEANLELARLKSPRTLSPEQQTRLVDKLKAFSGQKYSFNVFPDPEPINLLRLIDNVLKNAGWMRIDSQVGDIVIEGAGSAHDTGLQIGIKRTSSAALQQLAAFLAQSLTSEELPASPAYIAELKFDDAININVGKKP
jgi:hypothetical protein